MRKAAQPSTSLSFRANRSKHPVLLRTTSVAGHDIGTALDERITEEADMSAFLFDQVGMKYRSSSR